MYLNGTRDAVKAFQKAAGLKVSGTATVETLEMLYMQELSTPAPVATPEFVVADETRLPTETPAPGG